MTKETEVKLLETVDKTVDRASELGDQWVGTLVGRMLDSERDHLLYAVKENRLELASVMVLNLANLCDHAEKLNETETV